MIDKLNCSLRSCFEMFIEKNLKSFEVLGAHNPFFEEN